MSKISVLFLIGLALVAHVVAEWEYIGAVNNKNIWIDASTYYNLAGSRARCAAGGMVQVSYRNTDFEELAPYMPQSQNFWTDESDGIWGYMVLSYGGYLYWTTASNNMEALTMCETYSVDPPTENL